MQYESESYDISSDSVEYQEEDDHFLYSDEKNVYPVLIAPGDFILVKVYEYLKTTFRFYFLEEVLQNN